MTADKKTPILVFGKHYVSALDIVRSLGLAGYSVHLAFITSQKRIFNIVAKSKFVSKAQMISQADDGAIVKSLISIAKGCTEKPLIFPVDDFAMSIMDKYADELKEFFLLAVDSNYVKGHLSFLMDKHNQSILAKKSGIAVPKEWVINLKDDISIPDEMIYPCFCKPTESVEGKKTEQRRCNDSKELYEHLLALKSANQNRTVLVQEFLEMQEEYIVIGACLNGDVKIPGIVKKLQSTRYVSGLVLLGSLVKLSDVEGFESIEQNIREFLLSCNYTGLFDLEFSKANGQLYFNELNIRASGLQYAVKKAGVNLPAALANSILTGEFDETLYGAPIYNRIFIKEKNIFEDFLAKKASVKYISSLYKKADDRLMSEKGDIAPALWFYYSIFYRWAYPKLKRLLGR